MKLSQRRLSQILGKGFSSTGGWALEQDLQGTDHNIKPDRAQESIWITLSGTVFLGAVLCRPGADSIILMLPLQLSTLNDCM